MKILFIFWIFNINFCLDNYKVYFEKEYKYILFYYDNKCLN